MRKMGENECTQREKIAGASFYEMYFLTAPGGSLLRIVLHPLRNKSRKRSDLESRE